MIESLSRRARICGSVWKDYPLLCLAVSVGKAAHEGEDLAAAVAMLAATGKPCLIRLSDTLQRHNLMAGGMGADESWITSRQKGDDWLERNSRLFKALASPPIIVRWDQVLKDPEFSDVHTAFVHLAQDHNPFAAALQSDVDRFLARRPSASREEATIIAACSRAFLLEEVAGQTILGRHYSYARFYPGKALEVLQVVRDGKIHDAPKGLENTAFVRFQLNSKTMTAERAS